MIRVSVAAGEIIYQKIVFTKILSVTRVRKGAKPSAKSKFKQSKIKQGKKKKKDSRIKSLGTNSSIESEASSQEGDNSSEKYHGEWPMFSIKKAFEEKIR